jgi:hypothetical protein
LGTEERQAVCKGREGRAAASGAGRRVLVRLGGRTGRVDGRGRLLGRGGSGPRLGPRGGWRGCCPFGWVKDGEKKECGEREVVVMMSCRLSLMENKWSR